MSRQLSTQKQIQDACRLSFCYLCGCLLGPSKSLREHIVPKGILSQGQSPSQFALTVPVHAECESRHKRPFDDEATNWLSVMESGPAQVHPRNANRFAMGCGVVGGPESGQLVFNKVGKVKAACWGWVRGLHAVLYNEFLPIDTPSYVAPPVPHYTTSELKDRSTAREHGLGLLETREFSEHVLSELVSQVRAGLFDGVSFWGRSTEYYCAWLPPAESGSNDRCVWMLITDRTTGLKRNDDWPEFPWHGSYQRPRPALAGVNPNQGG